MPIYLIQIGAVAGFEERLHHRSGGFHGLYGTTKEFLIGDVLLECIPQPEAIRVIGLDLDTEATAWSSACFSI
jgi:hypothetical protein